MAATIDLLKNDPRKTRDVALGHAARLQIVGGHHGFGSIAGPSVRALGGMVR